jgi:hypothetical protein
VLPERDDERHPLVGFTAFACLVHSIRTRRRHGWRHTASRKELFVTSTFARRLVAGSLGLNALIHLILVPEYFNEKAYIGALFVALAAVSAWAAYRVLADDGLGWAIGALASAGAFAGFIASRTVGLPGFHPADWEASGLLTLALEAVVVFLFVAHGRRTLAQSASMA